MLFSTYMYGELHTRFKLHGTVLQILNAILICMEFFLIFCVKSCFLFFLVADQQERAFNLGLAAVLGKGVYNFGKLVSTYQNRFFFRAKVHFIVNRFGQFNF